jgi:hypothetical protein
MDALVDGLNLLLGVAKELLHQPNGARMEAANRLVVDISDLLASREALASQTEERGVAVYALGRISVELAKNGLSRTALRQIRATTEALKNNRAVPAPLLSQLPSEVVSRLRQYGIVTPFNITIPRDNAGDVFGGDAVLGLPERHSVGETRVGSGLEGETTFEPEQKPPPPKKNS